MNWNISVECAIMQSINYDFLVIPLLWKKHIRNLP
nr:MAG TPA: hypothetical protein [Bacteriophage sp.]